MSSKKCFFAALLVLASASFFTTESWAQSLSQYLVLNRVAYYKVRVHPEKVETANKGLKINLYILGGRIEGIIKGEFVQEKNIIVDGSSTINGDQALILPQGIGFMNTTSEIIADDGTIFYLRYTGIFQLKQNPPTYPYVRLLASMNISTPTNDSDLNYSMVTQRNYLGVGELNLLTYEVYYDLYPVP